MATTLTEIADRKKVKSYRENVYAGLHTLNRLHKWSYTQAQFPLTSFNHAEKDLKSLEEIIRQDEVWISSAEKEWEIVIAHLEIYNIEAKQIYEFLTGKELPNALTNNHYVGKKALAIRYAYLSSQFTEIAQSISRIRDEERDQEWGGGFGPSQTANLEHKATELSTAMDEVRKLTEQVTNEWNLVKNVIKEKNLNAAEYLVKIKELIATL